MQGRQLDIVAAFFHYLVVDEHGAVEIFGAVYETVPHRVDLLHRRDRAVFGMDESLQNQTDCHFMVGHILFDDLFALVRLVFENGFGKTDALAAALGDNALGVHIDELIF